MDFKSAVLACKTEGELQELVKQTAKTKKKGVQKLMDEARKYLEGRELPLSEPESKRVSEQHDNAENRTDRPVADASKKRNKSKKEQPVKNTANKRNESKKSSTRVKIKLESANNVPSNEPAKKGKAGRKQRTDKPIVSNPDCLCWCGCGSTTINEKTRFIKGHGNALRQRFRKVRGQVKELTKTIDDINMGLPHGALEYARDKWPALTQFFDGLQNGQFLDACNEIRGAKK